MKNLTSLSAISCLALAVNAANAATYEVYGQFTDPATELFITTGSATNPLINSGLGLTISGTVTTDSSTAGYNITGGNLHLSGGFAVNFDAGNGPVPLFFVLDQYGSVNNGGVVFDSGTTCIGFAIGDCSAHLEVISSGTGNASYFTSTANSWFGGYGSTMGLQLLGGAGGSTFTVSQPGLPTNPFDTFFMESAVGYISIAGNNAAIFLNGDLTFTEVPVPAAAWLFGSALLGLGAMGRKQQ